MAQRFGFDRRGLRYSGPVKHPGKGYTYRESKLKNIFPVLMTISSFFLVVLVVVCLAIFGLGWVKIVGIDGVSGHVYIRDLVYDVMHWDDPESISRLEAFLYRITH